MIDKERKQLLYLKHTWMDVFRLPLILEICILAISIPAYFYSVHRYGYFIKASSLSDWIFVLTVLLLIYVGLPALFAVIWWRDDAQCDEEISLEDGEIVHRNGRKLIKVPVTDISEIVLNYPNRFSIDITFKFRKKHYNSKALLFGGDVIFRKWISPEELEKTGLKIWTEVSVYNPEIELKRLFPGRKYLERWDGSRWVPVDQNLSE